jgi:TonB family protein
MPPTIKENDTLTATPETAASSASTPAVPGDAFKQQPVALEVAVSVNGARTIEGSDKREPFSETTKTVLVFGNGAVIRLTSSVAPGQLLFLTNEKTKKEVVCQVVKSKNYRNVSGYVELEFTESVVGFWGMRFPGDRIGVGPQPVTPAPVAARPPAVSGSPVPPRPPASRVEESAGNIASSVVPVKPAIPVPVVRDPQPKLSEAKFVVHQAPITQVPAPPKLEAPLGMQPVAPVVPVSPVIAMPQAPTAPLTELPIKSIVPTPPVAVVPSVRPIPELTVDPAPAQPITPAAVTFDFPRASEVQASILEPPRSAASSSPSTMVASSFSPVPEIKPGAPAVMPPPVASDPETEALKQHTARLQEQLSSLLFAEPAATPPAKPAEVTPAVPIVEKKEILEAAAQLLEIAQAPEPAPVLEKTAEPVVTPAALSPTSLDEEELKIPAWLEPLARNAAAPSSTQELILREKARRSADQAKAEEAPAEATTVVEESQTPEVRLPLFVSELPIEEDGSSDRSATGRSGKGLLFAAIAAGILILAASGWWFMNQQSRGIHTAAASKVQGPAVSAPAESLQSQSQGKTAPQTDLPAQTNSTEQRISSAQADAVTQSNPVTNPVSIVPAGASTASERNSQSPSKSANGGTLVTASGSAQPALTQVKKPILGDIHLATPIVTQKRSAQNNAEDDAGIALSDDQPESNTEALNTGLVGGNSQPAAPPAPVAVGGDVKQAKLLTSVPPVYPAMAKNQHVSGNVLIDALIDANGRVTTMKIVSGPALLHQAAMDALKQWKYQPATLDGKATAMHLTVTIQFRLQ